ncbi:GNAT family N-acetyltransferase [Shewanella sp. KT0246]|uniref:GNAT family N-acetyltransferase n=1 Tax=Shewanella sp. KT0246 TaxID=2815912 RepID=UPI001BC70038|nr:GNAT family N-acetyltransferase [Shewanella sp. KT0246]GIU02782.1 hypothetical protein TUM4249_40030 [Shewanella sp. KT0246]
MHEFETERLTMRLLQAEDKDFYIGLYCDPKIMRHVSEPFSLAKATSTFETGLLLNNKIPFKQVIWAIINKGTKDVIGIQSIAMRYENELHAEAGLMLARRAQGKGFPEEALVGMLNYSFNYLKMETIFAYCSVKNRASERVVVKAGFNLFASDETQRSFYIKAK